jgi:hypothetical protein
MTTRSPVSPEVRALLEQERVLPPLSASQRARAMARARAALAAPVVTTSARSTAAPRTRWAAAAAAVLVVGAAVGAAAYEIHAQLARKQMTRPVAVAAAPAVASAPAVAAMAPAPPAAEVAVPDLRPTPAITAAAPSLPPADAARAELRLLRQARAAVARGDFAAALPPIAEHTRRFKNGRLVEEREALRVKALVGLGRAEEARHAAADFRTRFPRSVLLPAVSRMPAARP